MTTKGDELQRLYEWAGNLAEELEELQDAIFDLAEGEDDDGGPVPERCGGGKSGRRRGGGVPTWNGRPLLF